MTWLSTRNTSTRWGRWAILSPATAGGGSWGSSTPPASTVPAGRTWRQPASHRRTWTLWWRPRSSWVLCTGGSLRTNMAASWQLGSLSATGTTCPCSRRTQPPWWTPSSGWGTWRGCWSRRNQRFSRPTETSSGPRVINGSGKQSSKLLHFNS